MSDYDFRTVRQQPQGGTGSAAVAFSGGLAKYLKGTLLAGQSPAAVSLLDMKNQATIRTVAIDSRSNSKVLGLAVLPQRK